MRDMFGDVAVQSRFNRDVSFDVLRESEKQKRIMAKPSVTKSRCSLVNVVSLYICMYRWCMSPSRVRAELEGQANSGISSSEGSRDARVIGKSKRKVRSDAISRSLLPATLQE